MTIFIIFYLICLFSYFFTRDMGLRIRCINKYLLAMMYLHGDYETPDPELFADIQKVYDEYFKPPTGYKGGFVYDNAVNYGFTGLETKYFKGRREYTADEYIQYIGTHSDHIMLEEPYRTPFFEGVYKAVNAHGGKVVYDDTYILKTVCKP